jgi:hypothetical protein
VGDGAVPHGLQSLLADHPQRGVDDHGRGRRCGVLSRCGRLNRHLNIYCALNRCSDPAHRGCSVTHAMGATSVVERDVEADGIRLDYELLLGQAGGHGCDRGDPRR